MHFIQNPRNLKALFWWINAPIKMKHAEPVVQLMRDILILIKWRHIAYNLKNSL